MAHYLIEVGYTAHSWKTQIDARQNVVERITPMLDSCSATLQSVYYAFGDSDLIAIIDFKSAEDAAAFGIAVTAGGALRSFKTTALLTVDQGLEAMKRASELRQNYAPPVTVDLTQQTVRSG
jgi:uncharacterized protein with GYD domain